MFRIFIKKNYNTFLMEHISFGERLMQIRKSKGWSQEELAEKLGTKGPAVGRYERGTAKPTIEVAGKIARILGVSLDYLVGNSDQQLDSPTLQRILDVQNLPNDIKEKVYYLIDVSVKDYKTRVAYAQ